MAADTQHECTQEKRITDGFDGLNRKLDKIIDCLYGNGQPGLKTQVFSHEEQIKLLRADVEKKSSFWSNVAASIVTFIALGTGLIMWILNYFNKIGG